MQCKDDGDCDQRVSAATCEVASCNKSTHACEKKSAERGTSCSAIPNGKCNNRQCVECLSPADCPTGNECVSNACRKTPRCGDGTLDSGEMCDNGSRNSDNSDCTMACKLNQCGDGLWNRDGARPEECDLKARSSFPDGRAWDQYSCNSSCQRRYIQTPCNGSSDCAGHLCENGMCSVPCSSSADPLSPCSIPEIGRSGFCYGRCFIDCTTNKQCPSGTQCVDRLGADSTGKTVWACWSP